MKAKTILRKLTLVTLAAIAVTLPAIGPASGQTGTTAVAQSIVSVPQIRPGDMLVSIDMPNQPSCYSLAGMHWPPVAGHPFRVTQVSAVGNIRYVDKPGHLVVIRTGVDWSHSITIPDACDAVAVVVR